VLHENEIDTSEVVPHNAFEMFAGRVFFPGAGFSDNLLAKQKRSAPKVLENNGEEMEDVVLMFERLKYETQLLKERISNETQVRDFIVFSNLRNCLGEKEKDPFIYF